MIIAFTLTIMLIAAATAMAQPNLTRTPVPCRITATGKQDPCRE